MYFQEASVTTKVGAIVLFTFLTAPIGAHLIGRAAYILGVPMWKKSVMDDLKGQYKGSNQDLQSNSTDEAKSLLKEE
jgi:multicomponent Na+:H+ antiporter subunit G